MAKTPKHAAAMSFPFAFFGAGSARPIREKDGLLAIVVFDAPLSEADFKAIEASVPPPLRRTKHGARWLSLASSDRLATDVRAWAKERGVAIGAASDAACAHLSAAIEAWARALHGEHPIALLFVGSEGPHDAWHDDTSKRFAERVRPAIEALQREGANDHADWIAASFLRSGGTTTLDELRALADGDPPGLVGNIQQRCRLAFPIIDAVGPSALEAAGPYAELGFWACASIAELVVDPAAHADHLVALADACDPSRSPAVAQLLVLAACSLMRDATPRAVSVERPKRTPTLRPETFAAAQTLANRSARDGALAVGGVELLVDAARTLGGARLAVAIAKPFLSGAFDLLRAAPPSADRKGEIDRAGALAEALTEDLAHAPDADVAEALTRAPVADAVEQPIAGAKRPHVARLGHADRLEVRYRGADVPQRVTIEVVSTAIAAKESRRHCARAVKRAIDAINAGLGGGDLFAPEAGHAALVEAPADDASGPEFVFTLDVKSVDPRFWALAIPELAKSPMSVGPLGNPVEDAPRRIRIVGELPVDDTRASMTTDAMVRLLADPTPAFAAYAEPLFPVNQRAAKVPAVVLKPASMSTKAAAWISEHAHDLGTVLGAHPDAAATTLNVETSKTQIKIRWSDAPCPASAARGPILNFARRLHVEMGPLASVEISLGA